jgi:hypothetical protein
MERGDVTVDPATFRANLVASGVRVVVVVHLRRAARRVPDTQQAALAAIPDAHLLYRSADAAVSGSVREGLQ